MFRARSLASPPEASSVAARSTASVVGATSNPTYYSRGRAGAPLRYPRGVAGRRVVILVADGVGCGGADDAAAYGDAGADTLGHLAGSVGPGGLALPNLGALGLGHVTRIAGVPATPDHR